jgi:hypothetical protein
MSIADLMSEIERSDFATAVAESTWLFPLFETIHVLALTIVLGSVAMIDVRLLGLGNRHRPISELCSTVLPWTWSAFGVTVVCGLILFSSKATTYYVNLPFRIKLLCLAAAGLNMIIFHWVTARDVHAWEHDYTPLRARFAGAASLCLWVVIAGAGRWIGFTR